MRKPDAVTGPAKSSSTIPESEKWLVKFPTVCEYLSTTSWEDGTPREASALSVSVQDGCILIALNDKDLKQSLYTSAESLLEALKLMEGALSSNVGQWRPWKAGKKK